MRKLNYNILASGSSGNCVVIEDVMFDLGGINIKHFPEFSKDIDMNNIQILTHSHPHSDHYNPSLDWWLYRHYPNLKITVRSHMYQRLWNDMDQLKRHKHLDTEFNRKQRLIKTPDIWETDKLVIKSFDLPHGSILSTGHYGFNKETNATFFMATDFDSINILPLIHNVDYVFIEGNHERDFVQKLHDRGLILKDWVIESSSRHLSIEDSRTYANMIASPDAEIHYLHKSSRFFDLANITNEELIDSGQTYKIGDI